MLMEETHFTTSYPLQCKTDVTKPCAHLYTCEQLAHYASIV